MANTPEAEEQEEQLEEQQLDEWMEEELEEEIKVFVPPKHAKKVYHAKPKPSIEDLWEDNNLPSIDLICTKDYSNINRIAEQWTWPLDGWELAQMERENEMRIL